MAQQLDHTPLDRRLARLAERQHGVVASRQLELLGLSRSGISRRVTAGRLHRIHRGVYAVGHRVLTTDGHFMAAVLACGPGAVLSHHSAAEQHALRPPSSRSRIDVTSPRRAGRRHDRIRVHSGALLMAADVTEVDGIPCTSVARTLLDLAEVVDGHTLDRVLEKAEALRIFDLVAIDELLARSNGRRGARRLRRAIARYRPSPVTRSALEELFLALCAEAGFPRPLVNTWLHDVPGLGDIEVDFMWREEGVMVETDGHETHGTRAARARDLRRDRILRGLGWQVERFTWEELTREPQMVIATLEPLLSPAVRDPRPAVPTWAASAR